MNLYRLMVLSYSIFTLSIQLIFCASVYSNFDPILFHTESICNEKPERFLESEGKESSLILDLLPGLMTHKSCKRILTAPESHGFFIRLARPNMKKFLGNSNTGLNIREIHNKHQNSTRSCPLSIYNINDQLSPPWKIDPCQIEYNNDQDEPVRLVHGHIRMIWEHNGNAPAYKVVITVLGRGFPCKRKNKQPCLKFGSETLLCISKDLICDGIRHCPKGGEYENDEDFELCSKRKNMNFDKWENLTMEIFRNFLTNTTPTVTTTTALTSSTSIIKIDPKNIDSKSKDIIEIDDNKMNTTRNSITGDLSRYGPWGYLMLGMLLCGGALLICGLWECCCRHNKTTNDTTVGSSNLQSVISDTENTITNTIQQDPAPPTYEDLDPPPPYSVLFPNQKLSENIDTNVLVVTSNENTNNNTISNTNSNSNSNINNSSNTNSNSNSIEQNEISTR